VTISIPAHRTDLVWLKDALNDELMLLDHRLRYLDVELQVRRLESVITDARRSVDVLAGISPESPELVYWCGFIARGTAALFSLARRPERVRWGLLGKDRTLVGAPTSRSLQSPFWLTGFWLAWASRDAASLELLVQAPAELIAADEAFDRPVVQLMQAAMTGSPAIGDLLVEALELADPDLLRRTDQDWLLDILTPVFECLYPLIEHDEARFTAALTKLLDLRREYFEAGRAKGMDSVQHLSEEGVGLVAWAKALGFDVPVASPYLPPALVDVEPSEVAACPECATPSAQGDLECHACAHPLGDDALRFDFDEWLGLDRDECCQCGYRYPPIAPKCPVCFHRR